MNNRLRLRAWDWKFGHCRSPTLPNRTVTAKERQAYAFFRNLVLEASTSKPSDSFPGVMAPSCSLAVLHSERL